MKYFEVVLLITCSVSRPARGAWVEMLLLLLGLKTRLSRPARGAWVEIP